jgi:NAD+ diphosphatase
MLEAEIVFGGSRLDRASHLRGDAAALEALASRPDARALALWRGKPAFLAGEAPRLVWLPMDAPVLAEAKVPPVFLGLSGGAPRFAFDVSAWTAPDADPATAGFFDTTEIRHPTLPAGAAFLDLRTRLGALDAEEAGDAAAAKAILGWHETHGHCARCGAASVVAMAGWQRDCPACRAHHFPRTDPVVIVLATRGDRVLLGRSPGWPEGMFSLLAGFVEPGESLEAAARREVREEAGIRLGAVEIVANQPWPFPASLMIACRAEALSEEITVDPRELEAARWVTRQEVMESFAGLLPWLRAARRGAIARTVLEAWTAGRL